MAWEGQDGRNHGTHSPGRHAGSPVQQPFAAVRRAYHASHEESSHEAHEVWATKDTKFTKVFGTPIGAGYRALARIIRLVSPADEGRLGVDAAHTRNSTGIVRGRFTAGRGRHGRGLQGTRHPPRSHRRYQDPSTTLSPPIRSSVSASIMKRGRSPISSIRT